MGFWVLFGWVENKCFLWYFYVIASVAEWSIALDCKSSGLRPTEVRILPGAPNWTSWLEKKMSQGELARKLEVNRAYISNIENGRMNPTRSVSEKSLKH